MFRKKVPLQLAGHDMANLDSKIRRWWQVFEKESRIIGLSFSRKAEIDLVGFMSRNLNSIHAGLMWEYGPSLEGKGHRLVITSESRTDLRPLVDKILNMAPKIIGWEFYGYRPVESMVGLSDYLAHRTGLPGADFWFQAEKNEDNSIDLKMAAVCDGELLPQDKAFSQGFLFLETVLGEECLEKWVGAIEVVPVVEAPKGYEQGCSIVDRVNGLRSDIVSSLSEVSYQDKSDQEEWSLLEVKSPKADSYPEQSDLYVATTMDLMLWKAIRSSRFFASERFSRVGETFCYVKIDGSDFGSHERFADRSEIEDAITNELLKRGVGRHIGGGTGYQYSYIELALTDEEKGFLAIRKVLQKGRITKNSWILFHDSSRKAQWVGIWKESPCPPMRDFERN